MQKLQLGPATIFRPSVSAENTIHKLAQERLLAQFCPGVYTGTPANLALQCLYQSYEDYLNSLISIIASRDAAEFLLFQYDEAAKILHGEGVSSGEQLTLWRSIEPNFRRAIKYLVELICIRGSTENPSISKKESLAAMEAVLVCAEQMAGLAEGSGRFHSIFPGEYKLTVLPAGYSKIYEVEMVGPHQGFDIRLFHRVERDRSSRSKFVGMPPFDLHIDAHGPYLDAAFEKAHGASYRQFLSLLHKLIDGAYPAKGAFPTLFINRREALKVLRPSGLAEKSLSIMLDGFTVDPEKMTTEVRRLWNPKQENRALWRGFFLFPHPSGAHLMFSREMAHENYIQLVNRVCYKRLPKEWVAPETSIALGNLSAAAGQWFEDVVRKKLHEVNITGGRFRRKIGQGSLEVQIPNEVGEIDFLGFDSRTRYLVLIEAKMSFTGVEARFWRDDLDEFVYRERSYANQFRKKIAWVQKERIRIQKALGYSDIAAIAPAMLTLYPCIAREFISDFPCVSITEFRLDFQMSSSWPYSQILRPDPLHQCG